MESAAAGTEGHAYAALPPGVRVPVVTDEMVAAYLRGLMSRRALAMMRTFSDSDVIQSCVPPLVLAPADDAGPLMALCTEAAARERGAVMCAVFHVLATHADGAQLSQQIADIVRLERGPLPGDTVRPSVGRA